MGGSDDGFALLTTVEFLDLGPNSAGGWELLQEEMPVAVESFAAVA